MSDPTQVTRLIIQLGDGEVSETFAYTCGANSFGITLTNNTGETTVLDCTDPLDVAPAILRHLESQDTSATIAGIVAAESWPTWREWADDGVAKNIKLFMDESAANNGGFWVVPAILQSLELQKEGKGTVTFSTTIVGAGRRVWTDAS